MKIRNTTGGDWYNTTHCGWAGPLGKYWSITIYPSAPVYDMSISFNDQGTLQISTAQCFYGGSIRFISSD